MSEVRLQRRLAAVLAADVVGYSRMMGEDEGGVRARFNAAMETVIAPAITEHRGRLFKTMGDGLLAEFGSVVDAVDCAVRIQDGMETFNRSGAPALLLRIGVNLGDVIIEGDDVHGDGVNVAARLEGLAPPGGVCISRAARDQIRDKLSYELQDMGEVAVKNIARPIRAFGVTSPRNSARRPSFVAKRRVRTGRIVAVAAFIALAGLLAWLQPWVARVEPAAIASMALPLPDKPSVAVLPFEVAASSVDDRRLADAIAEDLTRGLARVSGLFVIARSSTLSYVGDNAEPARVSEELGVRHVVRATLRRGGDRVRIDAELVDAVSGRIVWSDRFDRASSDIFVLQDEIVEALAVRLASDLNRAAEQVRFTDDPEAWFAWFEADRESWLNTPDAYGKARALALKALERDPGFVRAKSVLAFIDTQRAYFGLVEDRAELLARAHEEARSAAAEEPEDWFPQSVYAHTLMNLRDYEGAATAYARAVEMEPADAHLLTRSSLPLIFLGRGAEAEARLRVAIRLNPFHDWLPDQLLGQAQFIQERYAESAEAFERARARNPRFLGNKWWRAAVYGQLGDRDKAAEAVAEILAHDHKATLSRGFIRIADVSAMTRFNAGLRAAGLPE
ncbi:MAG: adenylate/guanylate cyclase domain-containing protein [Pikeienuella sp.]|uniref:adenylate/guanylate cyclase domain-containing protein n=1 Tax=Pikeienuella sp. TaxID=2831957 RepID=UPI00391CF76E